MNYRNHILAIGFIVLALISVLPNRVMAVDSVSPIPVADSIVRDKEAGLTIFGYTIPGLTWDSIAIALAKVVLEKIFQATTDWVKSGFEGNPAYATDPAQFFTNIADGIAGDFIGGSDLAFLCSPFQVKIRLALQRYHTQRRQFQCTLTGIVKNMDAFYNDFSQGGWNGWFSMTQNDNNNPYGSFLKAQVELDYRIAKALSIKDKQLSWDSGFLGWSECIRKDDENGECYERGPTKTPGKVIESQFNGNLGSAVRQLELADEFDELLTALAAQLLKQAVDAVFTKKGLFNEGGGPPPVPVALGISKLGTGAGTVTSNPGGINCGSACFDTYRLGASVTLTAIPSAGSIFSGWPGACFGLGTCEVTMNTDRDITAMFDLSMALSIVRSGTGSGTVTSVPAGINCGLACRAIYPADSSVIITAAPASGSTFVNWSGGGCRDVGRTCVVRMSVDRDITAEFAR
ncbi:MAG: hypothetical protein Q7R69_01230 [bacterium]|nr:hypothetical protein [bacterium]